MVVRQSLCGGPGVTSGLLWHSPPACQSIYPQKSPYSPIVCSVIQLVVENLVADGYVMMKFFGGIRCVGGLLFPTCRLSDLGEKFALTLNIDGERVVACIAR